MTPLTALALRLHGPLQAWGGPVVGDDRPTLAFPTRSGVLGLLAACLGLRRSDMGRLAALGNGTRVHIRVDYAGKPLVDDQTIQDHPAASNTRQTIQSKRTYLCDASFVAMVVPGPETSLEQLQRAVSFPTFAPFLGRRNCPPSSPLLLAAEVRGEDPLDLFRTIPRGPEDLHHLRPDDSFEASFDFYLDLDDHPARLRRLRLRDQLNGPLPRQFRERTVVYVRRAEAAGADPWLTERLT